MIETSTTTNNLNYPQRKHEDAEDVSGLDLMFYENIKSQLNQLKREPSEESVARILAYSRTK